MGSAGSVLGTCIRSSWRIRAQKCARRAHTLRVEITFWYYKIITHTLLKQRQIVMHEERRLLRQVRLRALLIRILSEYTLGWSKPFLFLEYYFFWKHHINIIYIWNENICVLVSLWKCFLLWFPYCTISVSKWINSNGNESKWMNFHAFF